MAKRNKYWGFVAVGAAAAAAAGAVAAMVLKKKRVSDFDDFDDDFEEFEFPEDTEEKLEETEEEIHEAFAAWGDTAVTKRKQVLARTLVESEYLRSPRSDHLQPVLLGAVLGRGMRQSGDEALFPAFDYFA